MSADPEMPPDATGNEVEVKLLADSAAALRAVARRDSLGPFRLRPRGVARLRTTYLDTPQRTLLGNGIALRLRRHGRAWEATAKWGGSVAGAVHTRREINVPLLRPPRPPYALPEGTLRDELTAYVLGRPLQPVLTTLIRRQVFDLVDDHDTIIAELALDTVRHGRDDSDLREPYFEVEVEQRDGSREDLHALARILCAEHPLAPTDETKFQRAQRDVLGAPPPSPTAIEATDTWQNAARKVAAAQLARLRANDPRVRAGADPDPEAIHQMRVATRRLRTMVLLFADGIAEPTRTRLAAELEWLGSALGGARDLDVQLAQLDAVRPSGAPVEPVLTEFFRDLAATRSGAVLELRAALASTRYARLLRRLERFATPPQRQRSPGPIPPLGVGAAAATAIAAAHRAVRKQAKRATRQSGGLAYHKLRIRCRRLRYLLEFLAPLLDEDADWLIARMTLLQDLLGEANDRVILAHRLRRHGAAEPTLPEAQRAVLEESADTLLLAAGGLHEKFRDKWREEASRIRKRARALARKVRKQA